MSEKQAPDLSAMLGQVLNDPSAMQSIMQLAAGMRAAQSGDAEAARSGESADGAHVEESERIGHPEKRGMRIASEADRAQLLRSLRPFLGEERQKKADAILSILSLLGAAEKMGLVQNLSQLFEPNDRR